MAAPMKSLFFCRLCGKSKRAGLISANSTYLTSRRFSSSKVLSYPDQSWKPVIGLEIHAQIQAEGKLFSRASSKFGSPVNTQVAYLDSALPGTLPVLNKKCVEAGVKTAIALGCRVNKVSRFDRKHYFYADLPAGYQITQQNHAIANDGKCSYILYSKREQECTEKQVTILQLQLEQDSGKSLHDEEDQKSLIDLNRAGCGLMEIVTAPEFNTSVEARSFVRDLRYLLMLLGVCDGKMSEGSMRVDANISVHRPGEPLGVRSEVKNLNSLNSVKKAIDYEIQRQIQVLERGDKVENETRSFDVVIGATLPMRDKEVKQDYRFMPEPNLPPLRLYHSSELENFQDQSSSYPSETQNNQDQTTSSKVVIDRIAESIPVLPSQQRLNLIEKYGIGMFKAAFIVNEGFLGMYEELVQSRDVNQFTAFVIDEIVAAVLEKELTIDECCFKNADIGDLYDWYKAEKIPLNNVKRIIRAMVDDTEFDLKSYVETNNMWQINDEEVLTELCLKVMQDNPKAVSQYKNGKKKAIGRLMAEIRKMTNDSCNIRLVNQIFKKHLES